MDEQRMAASGHNDEAETVKTDTHTPDIHKYSGVKYGKVTQEPYGWHYRIDPSDNFTGVDITLRIETEHPGYNYGIFVDYLRDHDCGDPKRCQIEKDGNPDLYLVPERDEALMFFGFVCHKAENLREDLERKLKAEEILDDLLSMALPISVIGIGADGIRFLKRSKKKETETPA